MLFKSTEKGISVYSGELTLRTVLEQNIEIAKAFPTLPASFYDVLNRRIAEKEFTDERFMDAVNYVIDTCQYPTPTVAIFLSYDKEVELFTHNDLCKMLNENKKAFDYFELVKIPNLEKPLYAKKEDIVKYKLERWKNGTK